MAKVSASKSAMPGTVRGDIRIKAAFQLAVPDIRFALSRMPASPLNPAAPAATPNRGSVTSVELSSSPKRLIIGQNFNLPHTAMLDQFCRQRFGIIGNFIEEHEVDLCGWRTA